MTDDEIKKAMRWAIAISEDDEILLTVFEDGGGSTATMSKEMAVYLSEHLNRYIQLLS